MPVKTRVVPVAEYVRRNMLRLTPPSPRDWVPPPGEAALEFVNKPGVRQFSVLCAHGRLRSTFDEVSYATNLFSTGHPACPVRLVRGVWWPAGAAGVAARGVTATPDPAAQAALATVRAGGERIEAFLSTHGCVECVPGLSESVPLGRPEGAIYTLEHEARCPTLTKEPDHA